MATTTNTHHTPANANPHVWVGYYATMAHANGLVFWVQITGAKMAYGQPRYAVSPVGPTFGPLNTAWVNAATLRNVRVALPTT